MAVKTRSPSSIYVIAVKTTKTAHFILKALSKFSESKPKLLDESTKSNQIYKKATFSRGAMEEFDLNRKTIASQFGVHPSEVTDGFLKKKLDEARRDGEKLLEARAEELGIRLKPDTPEYRKALDKRAQQIIAARPK